MVNKELQLIREVAGDFPRLPRQINCLFEADAEIFPVGEGDLVVKIDSVCEEIGQGLYTDPFLIGWMGVTAAISDIAAVGAEPIGILLSLTINRNLGDIWMKRFNSGVSAACSLYHTFVLGGDTNTGASVTVTCTVIAMMSRGKKARLRTSIKPGDLLFASGSLGLGNAYAYCKLFDSRFEVDYQPVARLQEDSRISGFATAAIDTSDGLFPALATLSEVNNIGFELEPSLQDMLHPDAARISEAAQIPPWMLLAGPHGEYELLFAVDPRSRAVLGESGGRYLHIATATSKKELSFSSGLYPVRCHPNAIANLFEEARGKISEYYKLLHRFQREWTIA